MVRKSWWWLSGLVVLGVFAGSYLWLAPSTTARHTSFDLKNREAQPRLYHTGTEESGCSVYESADDPSKGEFYCDDAIIYGLRESILNSFINRDWSGYGSDFDDFDDFLFLGLGERLSSDTQTATNFVHLPNIGPMLLCGPSWFEGESSYGGTSGTYRW